jgi:hypothetical protein
MQLYKVEVSRLRREITNVYVEAPSEKSLRAKLKKLEELLYNNYSLDWHPDNAYDCDSDYAAEIAEEQEDQTELPDGTIFWNQIK